MITKQEAFDTTVRLLFEQGGPSRHGAACSYRDFNRNRKCAVGFWISDDNYVPSLEGCNPVEVVGGEVKFGVGFENVVAPDIRPHADLMHELQKDHDRAVASDYQWTEVWDNQFGIARCLWQTARRMELNADVVFECWPHPKMKAIA